MKLTHIGRPRLTYANVAATLALVVAASTGGAYAHGLIGPKQIKQDAVRSMHIKDGNVKTPDLRGGAVKTAKIGGGAVTRGKLAPNARPTVIRYDLGPVDFAADHQVCGSAPELTAAQSLRSSWSSTVTWSNGDIADGGAYDIDTWVRPGPPTLVCVYDAADTDAAFTNVSVFRTVETSQVTSSIVTRKSARVGSGVR